MNELQYRPLHPSWFYSYVDIPNLEDIRQELVNLVRTGDVGYRSNPTAYNIWADQVLAKCPKVHEFLIKMGLVSKFHRLLITQKLNDMADHVVHVDTYDPQYLTQSLNLGLSDYEGSYTSWHDTDVTKLHDTAQFGMDAASQFAFIETDKTWEIARLYYDTRAALVNTTILHRGNAQKMNRLICGFRFVPDLTDEEIIRLGVEKPYLQVD
jgi:hypothetical protein